MLHQTLLSFQPLPPPSPSSSSSFLFSLPSSSSSSSPALPFPDGHGRPLLYPPPALRPCSPQTAEMETVREMFVAEEMDERGNLLGDDFQVDDLLDLRNLPESEEEDEQMDFRAATESSFSPPQTLQENEPLQLYSDITVHETDAASLEWLSRFFDDCSKECSSPPRPGLCSHPGSGSSEAAPPPVSDIPVKAKRSKRIRGSGTVWWRSGGPVRLPDSSPASSSITSFGSTSPSPSSSASSSSFNSYYIAYEPLPPFTGFLLEEGSSVLSEEAVRPKRRGRKPKNASSSPPAERRCAHCGVSKTPQWRAGPLGAKTLCNACGVRFKSGRLLPEYRPACSPTFVSSVHSNSHRKVLEMRRKKVEQVIVHSAPPVPSF